MPQLPSCPSAVSLYSCLQSQATTDLLSPSMVLPHIEISHKWNYIIFGLAKKFIQFFCYILRKDVTEKPSELFGQPNKESLFLSIMFLKFIIFFFFASTNDLFLLLLVTITLCRYNTTVCLFTNW